MFKERIRRIGARPFSPALLVILTPPCSVPAAQHTLQQAYEKAARPALIHFAVPAALEGMLDPGENPLFFYEGPEWLTAAASLVTDEAYFLLIAGPHEFAPRWDAMLLSSLHSLEGSQILLTGSISAAPPSPKAVPSSVPAANPGGLHTLRRSLTEIRRRREQTAKEDGKDIHDPEMCLPAIKESPDGMTAMIGCGLPMVCSAGPVATMLADPAFVFGSTVFLLDCEPTLETLSLTAFLNGWRCFVPDALPLWPVAELPRRILRFPEGFRLPGTSSNRFKQLIGLNDDQPMQSAKAALGLFGTADDYPQRMPPSLKLSQKAYAAKQHLLDTHMPLLVSAFIDLPSPRYPLPFYQLRFGFLRHIECLPLVMFTGGSQERMLRAAFPHTHSYPDNAVLPRSLLAEGMTPQQHFTRSKPLLLYRAVQKQVEFSHAAWLDMDVLPHPVCPDAQPDFEPLMDDRIHLATVNGVPDASFVLMPVKLVPAVAREAKSITLLDAELKRDLSEELFWERLFAKKPEWFTIHPMPRRRLLFLSAFDPRFLSQAIRVLLRDLPPPYMGTAADGLRSASRIPKNYKETLHD